MKSDNIFSLRGKTAFVTGATGYLGEQMCLGLADAGAHIIVQGRNIQAISNLILKIEKRGATAEVANFDLLDEAGTKDYFRSLKHNKVHILVNNAYGGKAGTIETSKDECYRNSYEIGLVVAQRLFKLLTPAMLKAAAVDDLASCINIASMYGQVAPDLRIYDRPEGANPPFYGAVKAALIQWTKYAACEYGPLGLRVNSISPGPFPNQEVQSNAPDFINKLSKKVPMGRIGQAVELQGSVVFLASKASSFVNGINLQVDGGWLCQ